MAEFQLKPRSIFEAVGGCRIEADGLTFDEAPARSLVSLARRRGEAGAALDANISKAFGVDLPEPGRRTIWDLDLTADWEGRAVTVAAHCFGCTAGAGSSCGGALT